METPRWYCVRAKPGQDQIAIKHLDRQNFTTYYPRMTIERARAGRIVCESVPLFPGYILVHSVMPVATWRTINGTRGVLRLLSFAEDGKPSAVAKGEIEVLQRREKAGKLYISEVVRLRRGDGVRMKFGSAVDQIGEVLWTRGERVEFLLRLLGRKVKCIAPQHALELVSRKCSTGSAVAICRE